MREKVSKIPYYGTLALLCYMPFHIFLSQWLSSATGGLEVWKGAKDVFAFAVLVLSIGLVAAFSKKTPKYYWFMVLAGLLYGLLHVLTYVIHKDTSLQIAALATAYNCRLIAYLLTGWSAVLLAPKEFEYRRIAKVIIAVSTVVCVIGFLQYVLPDNVMTHFGYSLERGVRPAFFIDDKPDLPRVMSTLRDPNSLAAYLVVPITLLWAYLITNKNKARNLLLVGLLGLHLLVLFLTFSRAGWAGTFLALLAITSYLKKDLIVVMARRFWVPIAIALLLVGFGAFMMRDQYVIQNIIFHSDENTTAELDSNDLHYEFAKNGLKSIVTWPLGHGPGTAGIVSIQNPDGGLLTENYFIQIGYETGIVGLALFVGVWVWVARRLLKMQSRLPIVLFVAALAYVPIGMLSHVWTNEAVAAQWWLLAGLCVGMTKNKLSKSKA